MEAKILNNKSRLQEIYDLRVTAYSKSAHSRYVNKEIHPNGYFDNLDPLETTYHWIVEDNNKIVGSVRMAIINDLEAIGPEFNKLKWHASRPVAYWGRIVVHPDYRKSNIMLQLDNIGKRFIADNNWIKFAVCLVVPERVNAVKRLGFQYIGDIENDWGKEKTIVNAFILE